MTRKTENNKQTNNISKVRQLVAEIVFGMPSKSCKNYGICRIINNSVIPGSGNAISKNSPCVDNAATAILTLLDDNKIELHCLVSTIKTKTTKKYFQSKYFLVQEDYHLSPKVCQLLDVDQLSIKKGQYKIKQTKSLIKIKFY